MNENALSEASVVIRFAWTKGFSGLEADQKLTVDDGQVVEFAWQGNHNVYLLRDQAAFGSFGTSSCDWTGAQLIDGGASSGVRYTFSGTGRTLHFGCKVGTHCQMGQKLAVTIGQAVPSPLTSPTIAPPPPPSSSTPASMGGLVAVEIRLPMSAEQFRAQEVSFVAAIADAAGPDVTQEDVVIKSVREVSSGRREARAAARMLLATSVDVEVEIVTDDSASVMQDLTAASVTSELLHRGLPAPESFAAEVQETVAKTPNKNSTETGLSPIIIALATGGVFVAVALVALVVRKVNCGKGKEEPRGGGQASKVHADVTCSRMQHGVSQLCYKIDVKDGKKQPAHEQIPVSTDLEEGLFSVGPVVPGTQSTAKVMNVKLAEASVKSANRKSSLTSTRWHATVPTRSSSSSSSNSYGIVSQERDIGERLPDTLVLGSGVSRQTGKYGHFKAPVKIPGQVNSHESSTASLKSLKTKGTTGDVQNIP